LPSRCCAMDKLRTSEKSHMTKTSSDFDNAHTS
jgi:hypothetical protein